MALTQVSTSGIKDATIATADIAADAITGAKIADDAVGSEHIETLDDNLVLLKPTGVASIKIGSGNAAGAQLFLDGDSNGDVSGSDYSYIEHNADGDVVIGCDNPAHDANCFIKVGQADEYQARFNAGGSAELRYNNVKKFETTSTGSTVTGILRIGDAGSGGATNAINVGAGDDLKIFHDGTNTYLDNFEGDLLIRSVTGGDHTPGSGTYHTNLKAVPDGAVELYYDNSKKLQTYASGVEVIGHLIMGDDDNIQIGDSQDLKIYHNGTNSIIDDVGAGALIIRTDNALDIKDSDNVMMAAFNKDADVKLYYDGTVKFETTSTGCNGPGGWNSPDGQAYRAGNSNDLLIYHDGSNTYIDNDTGILRVRGSHVRICDTSNNTFFSGESDKTRIYHNDSVKLETLSSGLKSTGSGQVDLNIGSTNAGGAYIILDGDSNGDFSGSDYAYIGHNTNGDLEVAARRPSGGNAAVNLQAYDGTANSLGNAFIAAHDACWSYHAFYPWTDDNRDLGYSGRRWDDVYATNSTIQTSDRNTKDNITNTDLGLPFINKLTPKSYKFKGKTRTHYGLIAQDVETVLSDISKPTSGFAGFIKSDVPVDYYTQHDESIPEGKSIGDVKNAAHTTYGLRYSEFIAPLIKAVQELSTEVETLKTKVSALEAK